MGRMLQGFCGKFWVDERLEPVPTRRRLEHLESADFAIHYREWVTGMAAQEVLRVTLTVFCSLF